MNTKFQTTHNKLISCGMKLMCSMKFSEVTIPMICKEAGISRPNFYLHFNGKEQLLSEYYGSDLFLTEEMSQWIQASQNPLISIVRMQMLYISHTCNSDQADLIARFLSYRLTEKKYESMIHFNHTLEDSLIDYICRGQKEGMIQNQSDPYYLCESIFQLQAGHLFHWCASNGKIDRFQGFFWNLEAVLSISDSYRGIWKMEENFLPLFMKKGFYYENH